MITLKSGDHIKIVPTIRNSIPFAIDEEFIVLCIYCNITDETYNTLDEELLHQIMDECDFNDDVPPESFEIQCDLLDSYDEILDIHHYSTSCMRIVVGDWGTIKIIEEKEL